jgi:hypothetical protein
MKPILPPGRHALYPDRDLDCQEANEASFQEFIEKAVAAGWRPLEVAEVGQLGSIASYLISWSQPSPSDGTFTRRRMLELYEPEPAPIGF